MTSAITDAWPKMTSRQEFDFLTDLVLKHSTGDHTFLSLRDVHGAPFVGRGPRCGKAFPPGEGT